MQKQNKIVKPLNGNTKVSKRYKGKAKNQWIEATKL